MFWQRQAGADTRINPNLASRNRLWIHYGDIKEYLSSVCVKTIDWLPTGESMAVLEGLLQQDAWLLDIQDKKLRFEVRTGTCGNPTEYKSGKLLMQLKNLRSFQWWTKDVVSRDENHYTRLYCRFVCDWVEICES